MWSTARSGALAHGLAPASRSLFASPWVRLALLTRGIRRLATAGLASILEPDSVRRPGGQARSKRRASYPRRPSTRELPVMW